MRLVSRFFALVLGASALVLLSVSFVEIGMASLAVVNDASASRSTCSANEFFGARKPLCGIETGYAGLTDLMTSALNTVSPFYLWGIMAACSAMFLWLVYIWLVGGSEA